MKRWMCSATRIQFAPRVKTHLGVLVAAMFFLKAWGYKLSMYDLLTTPGKLFDGAGYTAVHANLPAFWVLLVASVIGGILVLVNIYRRGVTLAIVALAGVVGLSIVVGAAYPALVEQLVVQPNELAKQTPYINNAIAATRTAYGLTQVAARPFAAESNLTGRSDQCEYPHHREYPPVGQRPPLDGLLAGADHSAVLPLPRMSMSTVIGLRTWPGPATLSPGLAGAKGAVSGVAAPKLADLGEPAPAVYSRLWILHESGERSHRRRTAGLLRQGYSSQGFRGPADQPARHLLR